MRRYAVFYKRLPLSITSIITLSALNLVALTSQAQQPAESTSVIPYQGTLFSQGKPVSQDNDVLMAFALYKGDVASALPAGATNEAPDVASAEESPSYDRLWTSWETEDGALSELSDLTVNNPHTVGVKVRNGRFLVHLGAAGQTALPDSVFDQRLLYVVTWVVNGSGVFRLPAQRLEKVPHAVTAERANSFQVLGELTVGGSARVSGGVTAGGRSDFPSVRLNADGGHSAQDTNGPLKIFNRNSQSYPGDGHTHFNMRSGDQYHNYLRGDQTQVDGDLKVTGKLIPHYDSGWFPVSRGDNQQKPHSLGTLPVLVQVFVSPNENGVPAFPSGDRWKYRELEGTRGTIVSEITETHYRVFSGQSDVYDNYPVVPRTYILEGYARVLMWK